MRERDGRYDTGSEQFEKRNEVAWVIRLAVRSIFQQDCFSAAKREITLEIDPRLNVWSTREPQGRG